MTMEDGDGDDDDVLVMMVMVVVLTRMRIISTEFTILGHRHVALISAVQRHQQSILMHVSAQDAYSRSLSLGGCQRRSCVSVPFHFINGPNRRLGTI
ncbi:GM23150 [Drosophila sechellia]|uniref:GM23150 n=1 Tax=Drosophila sechellia TaxID=7238 RepID=B4II54_DROSE|nr:GM23150 [Drosophila sechellia]